MQPPTGRASRSLARSVHGNADRVSPSSEGRMASKEILSSSSSLKRPSVSLSSRFIRSSSVQGQLDRRTDSRGEGLEGGWEYVHFPFQNGREISSLFLLFCPLPKLSSRASLFSPPSLYPFPALPSPLPLRRCRHHISWPQKGICSRERIRPLPSPLSSRRRGREKRKERERVRASGIVGRVTQGFELPICSPFDDIMIIIFIRWETSPQIVEDCFSLCKCGECCDAIIIISDAPSFSQVKAENIFPSFPLLLLANFPSCNRDLECINEVEGKRERAHLSVPSVL